MPKIRKKHIMRKIYDSKFRRKYGMTITEISKLVGWSYGSCRNVLVSYDPSYSQDRYFLLSAIAEHLGITLKKYLKSIQDGDLND